MSLGNAQFLDSSGNATVRTSLMNSSGGNIATDKTTNAIVNIPYSHHKTHDGNHYNIRNFQMLNGSNLRMSFGVTTPAGSKYAHMTFQIENTNQVEIRNWEGATLSGGTAITPINNNRNSSNTSILIITSNPTISGATPTSGTLLEVHSKGLASTNPVGTTFGGNIDREDELILKANTTYLYEFKSLGGSNIIDYAVTWYEHTNIYPVT